MSKSSQYHNLNNCYEYSSSLEKITRLFDFDCKKLKIIDLGCGDGRLSGELVKKGHDVYGIDAAEDAIHEAIKLGIKAVVGDLEKELPFSENEFDVVIFVDVYEHLYDQETILKNIHRILKPDGKLIIAYQNHFDLRNRFEILFGKGIVHWAHRQYDNAVAWSYAHVRFLLQKEFEQLLNKNGFYIKKIQYNYLAGGIIPTRFTPSFFRKFILKMFPQALTGKYTVLTDKNPGAIQQKIYLPKTPDGL
jgi:methionine biosynthesis protein MetW